MLRNFKLNKTDIFSEILTRTAVGLIEKVLLFPEKFVVGICFIWKLMEYKNDHSPDAPIIGTFSVNSYGHIFF